MKLKLKLINMKLVAAFKVQIKVKVLSVNALLIIKKLTIKKFSKINI